MATILEAQGESQRLRILSMGAATLDAKALTVLSLDTATNMASGQATKIIFPFEFSRLMEGASDYLGAGRTVPERALSSLDDLEKRMGSINDVLGPIPKQEDLTTEIQTIENEIKAESGSTEQMISGSRSVGPGTAAGGPGGPIDPLEVDPDQPALTRPSSPSGAANSAASARKGPAPSERP
ncbi:SPFH domain / Band 7 family protein, partial [mine drainage metagenome]